MKFPKAHISVCRVGRYQWPRINARVTKLLCSSSYRKHGGHLNILVQTASLLARLGS